MEMEDVRIPSKKKKCEDRIPPEKKHNERTLSIKKNVEDQFLRSKIRVDNLRLYNKPYAKVSILNDTNSVTSFTRDYRVATSFGLIMSRVLTIHYILYTDTISSMLREDIDEID